MPPAEGDIHIDIDATLISHCCIEGCYAFIAERCHDASRIDVELSDTEGRRHAAPASCAIFAAAGFHDIYD